MVQNMMDNTGTVHAIRRMIVNYKQNPDAYSDDEVAQLKQYADAIGEDLGVSFNAWRALKNLAFEAADTASFGLLPDELAPAALNNWDTGSRIAGGLLGFLAPMGVGEIVAKGAMKGISKAAGAEGASFFSNLVGKGGKIGAGLADDAARASGGIWDDLVGQWKNVSSKYADDAVAAVDAGADAAKAAEKGLGQKIGDFFAKDGITKAAEYGDAALTGLARVASRTGMTGITESALKYGTALGLDQIAEDPFGAPGRAVSGAVLGGLGGALGKGASAVMGSEGKVGSLIRKVTLGLVKQGVSEPRAKMIAYMFIMNNIKEQGRFTPYANLY